MDSEQEQEKQNNSWTTKQIILYVFLGILILFVIYTIYRYITEIRDYKLVCYKEQQFYRGGFVNDDIDEDYHFSNYFNVIIGSLFRIGGKEGRYTYTDSGCKTLFQ